MEIVSVLKIQNRLIDAMEQSDSLNKLKEFNNELIEKIEFESLHPILFSIEITKLLVKKGFYHRGAAMGKSWSSYHNDEYKCYFRYNNEKLIRIMNLFYLCMQEVLFN